MIAFVVALEKEANPLLNQFINKRKCKIAGKTAYTGIYNGEKAVLILTNIGKVSAGLGTQAVIDKYKPNLIVNFGSCGGMKGIKVCDYYFVKESCQYDFDLSLLDNVSVGFNQGYDRVFFPSADFPCSLKKVKLATSDRFTGLEKDIATIEKLGASLFDMEGGAISQVALSNNVPFIAIKGVSDVYGSGSNASQFVANLNVVCEGFPKVIDKTLKEYFNRK